MRRMWIDQPSTLQPLHKYHGKNILTNAEWDIDGCCTAYFTEGKIHSIIINHQEVSEGWK